MKNFLLSIAMLTAFSMNAQQKSFVSFSVAPSFPLGDFGSTTPGLNGGLISAITSPYSGGNGLGSGYFGGDQVGYAKTGFFLSLDGSKYLAPNAGISGMIAYGANYYNTDPVNNSITNLISLSNLMNPGANITHSYTAKPYTHIVIMAGPTFGFTQDKIAMDFQFMIGAMITSFPNQTLSLESIDNSTGNGPTTSTVTIVSSGGSATSLAASIGATFRYSFSDDLALIVKPAIIWSKPNFNNTESLTETDVSQGNGNVSLNTAQAASINIPITVFNIGIGLAKQF